MSDTKIFTTEEVLVEFLTFFSADNWLRNRAVETVRILLNDPGVRIVPQSHATFMAGFELYAARPDKG